MRKNFIYFMATAMMAATVFVGCKKDDPEPDPTVLVSSITISPETDVTVAVGATVPLSVTVLPANAANKTVTWSSLHPNIATVDATSGLVTGVAEGEATIRATATDGSGVTADKTVIVSADAPDVPEMTMVTAAGYVEMWLFGTGEATIYWGDGTSDTKTLSGGDEWNDFTHTYSTATARTITITGENILTLDCGFNELTALDVGKNTVLTQLFCFNNQLTALDVSKNTALTELYCGSNQLAALDVSKNTLTIFDCNYNQLTALDVSKNIALTELQCGVNQLTTLDVSKNTALMALVCAYNQLTELDVSKNTALEVLWCYNNQLTTLDVSKNTAIDYLECSNNQITALDVSKNTALTKLWCYNNPLTILDVSKNTALTQLLCQGNQLMVLDVSKHNALEVLYCHNNQLTALDVSKNTALTQLWCYNNQLTTLDISKNTAMRVLCCDDNQLTALDVTNNINLYELWCNNNQLTAVALNALFGTLHSNIAYYPWGEEAEKYIFIGGNPGTEACDRSIAEAKDWLVYNFIEDLYSSPQAKQRLAKQSERAAKLTQLYRHVEHSRDISGKRQQISHSASLHSK